MDHAVEVTDNPGAGRFEITVDGRLAGLAEYRRRPGQVIFTHTEIGDAFEGQGLGSHLVKHALDSVRAEGLAVVPLCPFVAGYIKRHQEYQDLVAEHAES